MFRSVYCMNMPLDMSCFVLRNSKTLERVFLRFAFLFSNENIFSFHPFRLLFSNYTNSCFFNFSILSSCLLMTTSFQVEESIADVQRFHSLVKVEAFEPFKNTESALENCNSVSEGNLFFTTGIRVMYEFKNFIKLLVANIFSAVIFQLLS